MNMSEAMVQSSNIVFAKIATEVGAQKFYQTASHFGFGMKTSDSFYGEESGALKDPHSLAGNSGSDLKTPLPRIPSSYGKNRVRQSRRNRKWSRARSS